MIICNNLLFRLTSIRNIQQIYKRSHRIPVHQIRHHHHHHHHQHHHHRYKRRHSLCLLAAPIVSRPTPISLPSPSLSSPSLPSSFSLISTPMSRHSDADSRHCGDTAESANSLSWLSERSPSFPVRGEDVTVLTGPREFYDKLLEHIGKAEKRIVLASLYLGTDEKEQKLVEQIDEACRVHGDLRVKWLLDYNRGIRCNLQGQSSRSMLQTLASKHPRNVNVALFHTPDLRGWSKRLLPQRWNEIIGLSHLKLYIFDDTVIISGANLSDTYFTDRQDRYMMLSNAGDLVDFFEKLVDVVSSLSFEIDAQSGDLRPPLDIHPFEDSDGGEEYRKIGNQRITELLKDSMKNSSEYTLDGETDTRVSPLLQMAAFGITDDSSCTSDLLLRLDDRHRCYLASGYFNLTPEYMDIVVERSAARYSLLYASPEANGFHGAKGSSAFIPSVYTTISRRFLDRLLLYTPDQSKHTRVQLFEYTREAWSFHGKGIWLYDSAEPAEETTKDHSLPFATFIGSPNFGARSVYRDLELQLVIATKNKNLQCQLHKEKEQLFKYSNEITKETFQNETRNVPLWVKAITNVIRSYF